MGDIKTRFALEGESQFRSAMTNAANAIKVLNAEQKLAKASFQQTGDAEKYAAAQASILQQKITQQKAAVQAAQQAIKALGDSGVSPTSRQFQQWQTKLYNAQAALTNTETELQNLNNTMQQTTNEAGKTGTAIESIGKKVSLDAVISGLDHASDRMAALVKKAAEFSIAITKGVIKSAEWADELETTATVNDVSPEELQRMRYTADILDTTYESIMKSRQKLANAMQGDKDIFTELGVALREDVNGMMGPQFNNYVIGKARSMEDVFWDLGDALVRIQDEKGFEYVNKQATQLFGKSWEQLRPIFASDWASPDNYLARTFPELYGNYTFESAREYYAAVMGSWNVVPDEDVDKLVRLDDAVNRLQNELTTAKETLASSLAPAFESVTSNIANLVSQFNQYLQTEEGQAKLQALSDAFSRMVDGIATADIGSIMERATAGIDSFTKGLEWIKDNWSSVETGLLAIGDAIIGLKVSADVLKFVQSLAALKFLFGSSGSGLGGSLATGLLFAAKKLLPGAIGVGAVVADSLNNHGNNDLIDANGNLTEEATNYGYKLTDSGEAYQDRRAIIEEAAQTAWDLYRTSQLDKAALDTLKETLLDDVAFGELTKLMYGMQKEDNWKSIEDLDLTEWANKYGLPEIPVELTPTTDATGIAEEVGPVTVPVVLSIASEFGDILSGLFTPHANGIRSVPYDGYPAILHKGERVMPAREVQSRSYNSNLYVESMYMNNGTDADGLASAMAAAQRRTMSGFGS